jgi:hypothetical protein
MEGQSMLSNLSDSTVKTLLRVGKKNPGLRAFFSHPRAMIGLRDEAARRGIYYSKGEEVIVEMDVYRRMYPEAGGGGAKRKKLR